MAKKTVTKSTRGVSIPKAAGKTMTVGDVGVILTGIEDWIRYTRELIGTLPQGTEIDQTEVSPPFEDIRHIIPGKCYPIPRDPDDPRRAR